MTKTQFSHSLVLSLLAAASIAPASRAQTPPVLSLVVDETQAARRIALVHEDIRVHPGNLTLVYPKWIPGEHGPTGPIEQLAVLRIHAGDATLPWTRDPDDIYAFHVSVPAGIDRISVDFDTLIENTISNHQLLLPWSTTILYPAGIDKQALIVEPSVILPAGWKQGSSLHILRQTGDRIDFAPLSLERLIDSPVLAGEFFRAVPLQSVWPAELDITGDSQSAVDKADDAQAFTLFGKLIDQDRALFGFRHWQTLHILVSQSDARPWDGLEHEDSPYTGIGDAALSKKDMLEETAWANLAHEQSHSWDGKYRRPAELYSKPDYQGPERASMLWVYEGLNEYLGMLLATRVGFNDAAYARDDLAWNAAIFAAEPARAYVPLVDTATENWVLRSGGGGWYSLRRMQDYYDEGALIWLRVDTIIREQTRGRLSLDDFARSFFGQRDTGPVVVPYTRADVEAALSAVCPYDWHNFFETHIYQPNPKPPTDGIEAAGWRVVYNATPLKPFFWTQISGLAVDAPFSLGFIVGKDGTIFDVTPGTPAWDARLGPSMKILAVDGRTYSPDLLNEAIAHPQNGKITLNVSNFDSVESREIRYAGGARYPHLEQIPGAHDYLSEIFAPREDKQR